MTKKLKKDKALFIKTTPVVQEDLFLEEGGRIQVFPPRKLLNSQYTLRVPFIDRVNGKTVEGAVRSALYSLNQVRGRTQDKIEELEKSLNSHKELLEEQTEILGEINRYLD